MSSDTISISAGTQVTGLGSQSGLAGEDTITLSSANTIDLSMLDAAGSVNLTSPYTVTSSLPANAFTGGFTTGTGWMGAHTNIATSPASAKISLSGEGADIVVNEWSLVDAVKSIEQRLAIMQPNPKLESEWSELKQLGDQYRKLEKQILAKQATWDCLRAMPAPEID